MDGDIGFIEEPELAIEDGPFIGDTGPFIGELKSTGGVGGGGKISSPGSGI